MTKAKMKVAIEADGKGEYVPFDDGTVMFFSEGKEEAHAIERFEDFEEASRAAFGLALATGCNFTGEI